MRTCAASRARPGARDAGAADREPRRFITLEGIEGAGKSTVARFVCALLERARHTVLVTREPGGTPLAERVRGIVLERGAELSPADRDAADVRRARLHVTT